MDVIMQENNKSNIRQRKAYLFCIIGMAVDAVLGLLKIWMGWQSGSIAVIGDGFNNVTDAGSVFLLLLTFYYAAKPSDRTHPFGHGRLEYLNSTIMASAVLYVGISLLCNSAEKIMDPEPIEFSGLLAAVLIASIIGKLLLSLVYRKAQKETGSQAFSAYGADSLSDVLSTGGVLIAVAAEKMTGFHIDGWVGGLVALAVIYTGYSILKQAVNSIIGTSPDEEIYEKIRTFICGIQGIYGVHDLIIHDYGPGNLFLSAHVEMDSRMTLIDSHNLAEQAAERIKETFHMQAVIHVDPKAVDNPRARMYARDLESAIYRSRLPLAYHDFFVEESGEKIRLSFELTFTEKCKKTDQEIYEILDAEIKRFNPQYHIDMMIDRNFISGKRYGE